MFNKALKRKFEDLSQQALDILCLFKGKNVRVSKENLNIGQKVESYLKDFYNSNLLGEIPQNGIFTDLRDKLEDELKLKKIIDEI